MASFINHRSAIHVNGVPQGDAHTYWATSFKKVPRLETGQMFYREFLSGPIKFVRADYDIIMAAAFEDEFLFVIEESIDGGAWLPYYTGLFYKTDVQEFDIDNKVITVIPQPKDDYKELLEGLQKEFDLIKLNPDRVSVEYKKQPLFQIYLEGSNFLFNVIDGVHWEEPVPVPQFAINLPNFEFLFADNFIYIPGTGQLDPPVEGLYTFGVGAPYVRSDGVYRIEFTGSGPTVEWKIARVSDAAIMYRGVTGEAPFGVPGHSSQGTIFTSETTPDTCRAFSSSVWARVLTDNLTIAATPTVLLPVADLVDNSFNYTRCLGIDISNNMLFADDHQTGSERFGTFDSTAIHFTDEYFGQLIIPEPTTIGQLFPVTRSDWKYFSAWFYFDSVLRTMQDDGSKQIIIEDAYYLHNAVDKLLNELNPAYSHLGTSSFSEFLYPVSGLNPMSGEAQPELIIVPSSNILIGGYDKPAQRAIVKLSEIMEFYQYAYKLFFVLNTGSPQLRLEHDHYFYNGGSYTTPQIATDLTTLKDPKTGHPWSFRTNKYKFAKTEMPEQILTKWLTSSSEPFDGFPIEVLSTFVDKGNIQENRIGKFYSDIDFAQANRQNIPEENTFFILGCIDVSGQLTVPFIEFEIAYNRGWKMQNGYLSLVYLQEHYHRHNLPGASVKLNDNTITASSVKRSKVQELSFPRVDFDIMKLITTDLGTGKVISIEETVQGGFFKITIVYDNT